METWDFFDICSLLNLSCASVRFVCDWVHPAEAADLGPLANDIAYARYVKHCINPEHLVNFFFSSHLRL